MKKQITMERTLDGTLGDVWELWTTKEGIESWWGPEGFETKVAKLELRVGGTLEYSFTAGEGGSSISVRVEPLLTYRAPSRSFLSRMQARGN